MKKSLVMTIIGDDRPGLVESLAAIIEEHGGNWEESRMVRLAGKFAGLLRVHVEEGEASRLEEALGRLAISAVVARTAEPEPSPADARMLQLEVVGQDRRGIVHAVAEAIAALGINIEELETEVVSAAMSGEPLFRATARLRAPADVRTGTLGRDLEKLADDLMVEVRLDEPGSSS